MKNTIFDKENYDLILYRIDKINENSKRKWGIMSVNEMLCHVADQLRMALNITNIPLRKNRITRAFMKFVALNMKTIPPTKIQTFSEIDPKRKGTKPTSIDKDKAVLIALMDEVRQQPNNYEWGKHPMFGQLTKKEWGKIMLIHLDHHLRQFGT